MFVHQNQLQYQLQPRHYYDADYFRREREALFRPAWHLVGSADDLPRDGDYFTREILGEPLIVRRYGDQLRAFLNVCPHRHCLIASGPQGRSPSLKCQYHGWEFGEDGRTRKIPDAGCFRPFDRENARLHRLPLQTCGQLLFVRLTQQGPSLRDHLGPLFDSVDQAFQAPWACNWKWEHVYPANWKLPVENTVETYHLPCIHKGFFAGVYPSEPAQIHHLEDGFSSLIYNLEEDRVAARRQRWTVKVLGGPQPDTCTYSHHLVHPHLVFTLNDVFMHSQVYLPEAPDRTRTLVRMFSLRGVRRTPLAWLVSRITALVGRRMNTEVQTEDASVFGDQQRGIQSTRHPGCLGTREERIYCLQRFIAKRMQPSEGQRGGRAAERSAGPHTRATSSRGQ